MAGHAHNTVELPLTLHISEQAKEKLAARAAATGTGIAEYVSTIVEQSASGAFSLEALSGDVYQRFLASGTSDDELAEELERGKHELRAQRRGRQAT